MRRGDADSDRRPVDEAQQAQAVAQTNDRPQYCGVDRQERRVYAWQ
jgi:hypothetical protein